MVIDAGSGTGVLAIMAALCGAKKVMPLSNPIAYRSIPGVAEASGVGDIVEVVQGDFSKVRLPEKADVLSPRRLAHGRTRKTRVPMSRNA